MRTRLLTFMLAAAATLAHAPSWSQSRVAEPSDQAKADAAARLLDPANLTGEHIAPQSPADTLAINHGAAALQQLLLKLRTRASVMLIVAHPDDEDGGMLTYESRGQGARVAMLTLNRGEGGQNLMSGDFGDALGLIRTQELLAADSYMGVDQLFGSEADFGFSKTKEETFDKWTHERVLYDAVRCVRLYRPLVLASVFVGGVTDGHGHHQVAGEITQEVFLAAADPSIFPEMGLPAWAPLKVYARVPFARVTAQGMYDYATGKFSPPLFHNYITGKDIDHEPQATVLIHEGDPATVTFGSTAGTPALGMEGLTYVQFARKGLALQKSQIGPNVRLAPTGKSDTGYTLMASRLHPSTDAQGFDLAKYETTPGSPKSAAIDATLPPTEKSLFEGIDTSLPALAQLVPGPSQAAVAQSLSQIDAKLAEAQRLFTPDNIELTAPPLRDALRALDTLLATVTDPGLLHELRVKRVQLNNALALAHHLSLAGTLTQPAGLPQLLSTTHTLATRLKLTNDGANSMHVVSAALTVNLAGEGAGAGTLSGPDATLEPRTANELTIKLPYLAGLFPTRPYFSRPGIQQPVYDIATPALRNAPQTPAPIVAHALLDDEGVAIELAAIVPSPSGATPIQPLVVIPPVSVSTSPVSAILRPAETSLPITLHLTGASPDPEACAHPNPSPPEGKVGLTVPDAWTLAPETQAYDPACPNLHPSFAFVLTPPVDPAARTSVELKAVARAESRNYTESYRPVGYPGLTYTNLYTPATYKAVALDVASASSLRIGYLPGTGDSVASYLPNLGVTPTLLTPADLTPQKLAAFDEVILGVRAYAANPGLSGPGSKPLNDFAAAGGVVVVQYNSGGDAANTAPYPYMLPGDPGHNVVVEADPVTLLAPDAALFNWPNKITSADFDNWVEERGHGFASTWDEHYTPLVEVNDPGQDPQRGGLLLAPVGKGAYIYIALALYRQLPEGVPGAYRLLANLLSYPKNPQR